MSDASKPRSSSIDLGATVVVKRDGELHGQRGKKATTQIAFFSLPSVEKKIGWL